MTAAVMQSPIDPSTTRPAMRGIECLFAAGVTHSAVLAALGEIDPQLHDIALTNIVTRCAPMGAVPAEVVRSAFYNANPGVIGLVIPSAWDRATPHEYLDVQAAAFEPVLAAGIAAMPAADVAELAELSRTVGQAACRRTEGRPLFAGIAAQAWPDADHLAIWHAAKLMREHRGDSHIATLVVEDLSGVDALVIHTGFDGFPPDLLRQSRRWSQPDWDASVADLRARGWLTDDAAPTLTAWGRERRQWMEDRTDLLAARPYESIGQDGVQRMYELGQQLTRVLGEADIIPAHYKVRPTTN